MKQCSTRILIVLLACSSVMLFACQQIEPAGQVVENQNDSTGAVKAANFNVCANMGDRMASLLCENDELAALATRLVGLNEKAVDLYAEDELKTLKKSAERWNKDNDTCLNSTAVLECVRVNYQSRISELQITTGSAEISSSANYLCDAGQNDYMIAVFYNQTELPTVVLTRMSILSDNQKMAFRVRSGSGAKYQGKGQDKELMFWGKGSEAQVIWDDKAMTCEQQEQNSAGI